MYPSTTKIDLEQAQLRLNEDNYEIQCHMSCDKANNVPVRQEKSRIYFAVSTNKATAHCLPN